MKKRLNKIRRENEGFFLPYTIFIAMLVLLSINTIIIVYENNKYTNKTVNELVEIETLIQMTRTQFEQEKKYDEDTSGNAKYHHPSGEVEVTYNWIDDITVEATTEIETIKGTQITSGFRLYFPDHADKK